MSSLLNKDCEPFLRECAVSSAHDGPRLVFADFLEERGDPRGEFIRLQCALFTDRENGYSQLSPPDRYFKEQRAKEIADGNPREFAPITLTEHSRLEAQRGLHDTLCTSWEDLPRALAAMQSEESRRGGIPFPIAHLHIQGDCRTLETLDCLGRPCWQLRSLTIENTLDYVVRCHVANALQGKVGGLTSVRLHDLRLLTELEDREALTTGQIISLDYWDRDYRPRPENPKQWSGLRSLSCADTEAQLRFPSLLSQVRSLRLSIGDFDNGSEYLSFNSRPLRAICASGHLSKLTSLGIIAHVHREVTNHTRAFSETPLPFADELPSLNRLELSTPIALQMTGTATFRNLCAPFINPELQRHVQELIINNSVDIWQGVYIPTALSRLPNFDELRIVHISPGLPVISEYDEYFYPDFGEQITKGTSAFLESPTAGRILNNPFAGTQGELSWKAKRNISSVASMAKENRRRYELCKRYRATRDGDERGDPAWLPAKEIEKRRISISGLMKSWLQRL